LNISSDKGLALAWLVGKVRPPQHSATFLVKGTFALMNGAAAIAVDEPELVSGDRHEADDPSKRLLYASDFAAFKPRADVLVLGTAYAPGKRPVTYLTVRIKVGPVNKSLAVSGPRAWQRGALGRSSPSEPQPFVSVPITYENAYGGPKSKKNPLGRGFDSDDLPQVENPHKRVSSPWDDIDPAGFGPLAGTWGDRPAMLGTYNKKWERERWPWFPDDFDWGYFNAAPRDQQVEGYLRGDEELEFENLHPEHTLYRSRLPGLRARCFITDRLSAGELRFREVPLNLDTCWIDLDEEKLILVWRGLADVRTLKLKEIEHVMAVTAPLAEPPKSPEHYRAVLLAPPAPPFEEDKETAAREDAAFEQHMAEAEKRFAEAEQEFAQAEQELAKHEAAATKALADAKAALMASGSNAKQLEPPAGLQTPAQAGAALAASLAQLRANQPEMAAQIARIDPSVFQAIEKETQELEKEFAAVRKEMEDMAPPKATRDSVQAVAGKGKTLANQDLSELDLSGMNLTNANLVGAVLAKANLKGTKLAKANLSKADLTGADLTGADLTGAVLDGVDLTGAVLADAQLTGLSLAYATLAGLNLKGADLSGSTGRGAEFSRSILAGAQLVGVKFPQAGFDECALEKANFKGAQLQGASFIGAKAAEINLEGADLTGLQATSQADFAKGNFKNVTANRSVWEESVLDGADFSRASLKRAQFGDGSLQNVNFDRADLTAAGFDDACLRGAQLTNANLLRATFDRADLTGAKVEGSNCYEAGFWEAVTEKTDFARANVKGTLLS
jgi:uncharacterized protein YjbI with pentapeptide repeats